MVAIDFLSNFYFLTVEANGYCQLFGFQYSSKYNICLCSTEERNSYRSGTTWGWENDGRIFIFGMS